jgi:hypothetical protein
MPSARRGHLLSRAHVESRRGDVQELTLSDGRRVWQHVAELVGEWGADLVGERGLSSVGAVVGATVPRAVAEARKLLPQSVLLLPGVGAQGARRATSRGPSRAGPASALVTASRSVIFAYRGGDEDWRSRGGAEAARLRARGLVGLRLVMRGTPGSRGTQRPPPSCSPRRSRSCSFAPASTTATSHAAARGDDDGRRRPAADRTGDDDHGPGEREFYEIQAGDTLAVVADAARHHRRAAARAQSGRRPVALTVGQRIRVK